MASRAFRVAGAGTGFFEFVNRPGRKPWPHECLPPQPIRRLPRVATPHYIAPFAVDVGGYVEGVGR